MLQYYNIMFIYWRWTRVYHLPSGFQSGFIYVQNSFTQYAAVPSGMLVITFDNYI